MAIIGKFIIPFQQPSTGLGAGLLRVTTNRTTKVDLIRICVLYFKIVETPRKHLGILNVYKIYHNIKEILVVFLDYNWIWIKCQPKTVAHGICAAIKIRTAPNPMIYHFHCSNILIRSSRVVNLFSKEPFIL